MNMGNNNVKLNENQLMFFEKLKTIQEIAVGIASSDYAKGIDVSILNELTYNTIVQIMELIDGYKGLSLDLVDKTSNRSLKAGIELHDVCEIFLSNFEQEK